MRRFAGWFAGVLAVVVLVLIARGCRNASNDAAPVATGVEAGAAAGTPATAVAQAAAARKGAPPVIIAMSESGVRLRIERRPRIDVPSPPYADKLKGFQAAADNGDPVARYQLGLMLYECRDVPDDDAGLAKTIEEIHQTRRHGGWDVSDPAQEEQSLRQTYANCLGVPEEAREHYRDLLRSAADSGLLEAQLDLMYHLPKGEYCQFVEDCTPEQAAVMAQLREEARANVYKALEAGSAEALRTIGGWELNEEMGTPDDAQAYAYFRAYDQVEKAAGRERELTQMLASLRKRMRPVDLQTADDRAKELLSNPKCCLMTR